jgi:hypothetical protein
MHLPSFGPMTVDEASNEATAQVVDFAEHGDILQEFRGSFSSARQTASADANVCVQTGPRATERVVVPPVAEGRRSIVRLGVRRIIFVRFENQSEYNPPAL